MDCIIPGGNMKILSKAVHALGKIGDELYLEAKKDGLQLAAVNMNKTVYATFNFNSTFFSTYNVQRTSPAAITCKIHVKSILNIFKLKTPRETKIDWCEMKLERDATKIIFKLQLKHDVTIVHYVRLIDAEFAVLSYNKDDSTNQICATGSFFTQVLANFHVSDDDLSLIVARNKLTVKNYDAGNIPRCTRSEVALNANEFNTYKINQDTVVTLSLKPFRGAVQFAEVFGLNVKLNLETGGKPVVLLINSSTFQGNFVLATINGESATQSSASLSNAVSEERAPNWQTDCEDEDDHRPSTTEIRGDLGNDSRSEVIGAFTDVHPLPESPRTKMTKLVFARCFETSFHLQSATEQVVLAPNSDSDDEIC